MKKLIAFLAMLGSLLVAYGLDWYIVELRISGSSSGQIAPVMFASLGAMLLTISMILVLFWLMVFQYPRSNLISLLYFIFGLLAPLFLIVLLVLEEQVGEYLSHPTVMTVFERFFFRIPDAYLMYTSLGILLVGLISLIWAEEDEYDYEEWDDDEELDEKKEDEPAELEDSEPAELEDSAADDKAESDQEQADENTAEETASSEQME